MIGLTIILTLLSTFQAPICISWWYMAFTETDTHTHTHPPPDTHARTHARTRTPSCIIQLCRKLGFKTLHKVVEGNYARECWVKCIVVQLWSGETGTAFAGMQRLREPWPVYCVQQRVTLLYSSSEGFWPRCIAVFLVYFLTLSIFSNSDVRETALYFLQHMVGRSKNSSCLLTLGKVCFEPMVFNVSDLLILLLKPQIRSCEVRLTYYTFFKMVSDKLFCQSLS